MDKTVQIENFIPKQNFQINQKHVCDANTYNTVYSWCNGRLKIRGFLKLFYLIIFLIDAKRAAK